MTAENDPIKILGKHIRRLRRERDLSQEALAWDAHIGRGTVSDIERGVTVVGVSTLFQIAKALDVPPSKLFEPFDPKE